MDIARINGLNKMVDNKTERVCNSVCIVLVYVKTRTAMSKAI